MWEISAQDTSGRRSNDDDEESKSVSTARYVRAVRGGYDEALTVSSSLGVPKPSAHEELASESYHGHA